MISQNLKSIHWWIVQILSWVLGGVFVYAGLLKLLDPGLFLLSLRSYHLFPDPFAAWIALGLPWLETLAGVALATGWFHRGGLWILNALLSGFIVVLLISFARGLDVDCGCFGGIKGNYSMHVTLARDIVLLGIGWWLTKQPRNF